MFSKEIIASVVRMYGEGKRPSQILRDVLLLVPDASVPDLKRLMQEAFSLPYEAVQCIDGWWHDGTGELSDAQLDSFLVPEIMKVSQVGAMKKIVAPEESRELIRSWLIHAKKSSIKHEEAARRLESQHQIVGIASTILSVAVGSSIFASLEASHEPLSRYIAGSLSLLAAGLAGVMTFLRYEERLEKHRTAAVSYKRATRRLEILYTKLSAGSTLDEESRKEIEQELDEIEKLAPVVPDDINRRVEKRFKE